MPNIIGLLINLLVLALIAVMTIWGIGVFASTLGIALPAAFLLIVKAIFILYGVAMVIGFLTGTHYVRPIWLGPVV